MERVAQLAAHFKVPAMVCVNKYDLNIDQTKAIENLADKMHMAFLGHIPFDPVFTEYFQVTGGAKAGGREKGKRDQKLAGKGISGGN